MDEGWIGSLARATSNWWRTWWACTAATFAALMVYTVLIGLVVALVNVLGGGYYIKAAGLFKVLGVTVLLVVASPLGALLWVFVLPAVAATVGVLWITERVRWPMTGYREPTRREQEVIGTGLALLPDHVRRALPPLSVRDRPSEQQAVTGLRTIGLSTGYLSLPVAEAGGAMPSDWAHARRADALAATLAHQHGHWRRADPLGAAVAWGMAWPLLALLALRQSVMRPGAPGQIDAARVIVRFITWPAALAWRLASFALLPEARTRELGADTAAIDAGVGRALAALLYRWRQAGLTGHASVLDSAGPAAALRHQKVLEELDDRAAGGPARPPEPPTRRGVGIAVACVVVAALLADVLPLVLPLGGAGHSSAMPGSTPTGLTSPATSPSSSPSNAVSRPGEPPPSSRRSPPATAPVVAAVPPLTDYPQTLGLVVASRVRTLGARQVRQLLSLRAGSPDPAGGWVQYWLNAAATDGAAVMVATFPSPVTTSELLRDARAGPACSGGGRSLSESTRTLAVPPGALEDHVTCSAQSDWSQEDGVMWLAPGDRYLGVAATFDMDSGPAVRAIAGSQASALDAWLHRHR